MANNYVYTLHKYFTKFNSFLFSILREQSLSSLNELLSFEWCRWNASTPDCGCVYDNLINKRPVVVAVYNQAYLGATTLKVKVPAIPVDIIDMNNQLVPGEIVCANRSLTYDCDLYF